MKFEVVLIDLVLFLLPSQIHNYLFLILLHLIFGIGLKYELGKGNFRFTYQRVILWWYYANLVSVLFDVGLKVLFLSFDRFLFIFRFNVDGLYDFVGISLSNHC